ncbi:Holliday junction resolvase RuvX [Acidocella sp.]|uniref:Holliday junction resolvase RuvX n=1 Tax=Acidocella sp. TaxID=50710 RepID=UPI003D072C19
MALYNLPEFLTHIAPGARLLGLDPGSKRIGVALSDVNRSVASPYTTLTRARMKQNAAELAAIVAREGVGGLIVGLPLDDGQKLGPRAQAARDWAHGIGEATGLPVAMVDESYSTAETHERLISAGVSRARRAEIVDKLAAAEILQRALDQMRA